MDFEKIEMIRDQIREKEYSFIADYIFMARVSILAMQVKNFNEIKYGSNSLTQDASQLDESQNKTRGAKRLRLNLTKVEGSDEIGNFIKEM